MLKFRTKIIQNSSIILVIILFFCTNFVSLVLAQDKKPELKNSPKPLEEKSEATPSSKGQVMASFADIIEDLLPSVVNISTSQEIKNGLTIDENFLGEFPRTPIFEDLKRQLDMQLNGGSKKKAISIGSGFIISADGLIVTNNHVINDSADIDVSLHDGSKFKAKIIGIDKKTDLALLKINPTKELNFVKFGDSNKARIGDWTIVVGNPYGFGGSVSVGIVSARGRDINNNGQSDEYIQTDAAINKGNSGGPIFNSKGEVIGISTAIFSPSGGSVGIGFATPSSVASSIIKQLREKGEVSRGWIGVSVQEITDELAESLKLPSKEGAFVTDVTKGGPADKAGIIPSDIIMKFDEQKIDDIKTLPIAVSKFPIGKSTTIFVLRNGSIRSYKINVGKLRDEDSKKSDSKSSEKKQNLRTAGQILGMSLAEVKSYFKNDKNETSLEGLMVVDVNQKSEAYTKGVVAGDVILSVNQVPIKSISDFNSIVKSASAAKKKVFMLIKRGDSNFALVLSSKQ